MQDSAAMGTEKIGTLLWRFSAPAIIGMLVNALYNIVDSIFVGNGVGEIALAAVAIAFPVMTVLMGFGMLIGIGAGSLVSIRMGENRTDEAEKILGSAFVLTLILAVCLSLTFLVFLDQLLVGLGAETNVLPYAREFTSIILWGSVFLFIGFGMNNIIRAQGDPKTAMATMLISAGINIVLNPLFIFVFHMGIGGSALATVVAQTVSSIWVIAYFLGERSFLKLRLQYFTFDGKIIMQIINIGLSPFLVQIAASVVSIVFNYSLLSYGGELAVASIGIINRMALLLLMPIFGISQGVQPIIGYNYGARNYKRVIEAVKLGVYAASAISLFGFIVVQLFSENVVALFNQNPQLIEMGSGGLRLFLCMLPIIGFQVISANYFQAVGKVKQAIFLSMSRQVFLLIPLIIILPTIFGLTGAWIAAPIADLGAAIITAFFLFKELSKFKQVMQ
ncbi:putative membrane protein [Propionispora sp. 2/2-37]|uniref:MATE family efflux transporter n=1 Tax=Propionispora sp. 2/2-37 TaxID=1677858 RepID=UPI0006BB6758|nr:MATE family efflux transporter [Propionispora sp. 2/2-37]CUH94606.1 putative membrane protein [Propionispora sp. 2/2-37]